MLKTKFEIGEKAITVSDKDGVFALLEVEIYGLVYQDFEKDKPVQLLYVFDLDGTRRFGNEDIMFKTNEEALEKLKTMVPEYEKGYAAELLQLEENRKNLEDHKNKLINSALDLINAKTNDGITTPSDDSHSEPTATV